MAETQSVEFAADNTITGMSPNNIIVRDNVRDLDKDHVAALVESIKVVGILSPLVVTQADDGYELVAGFHRHAAATAIGLDMVPVVVRNGEQGRDTDAAVENIVRKDLSPYEEAVAVKRAVDSGLTPEGAAMALGWSLQKVNLRLRVFDLPEGMQTKVGVLISLSQVEFFARIADQFPKLAEVLDESITESGRNTASAWFVERAGSSPIALDKDVYVVDLDKTFRESDILDWKMKSKLRKAAKEKLAEAVATRKHDWEHGPDFHFHPDQIDQIRAMGCLLEITEESHYRGGGQEVTYLLVDNAKREVLVELVNTSLEMWTKPEKEAAPKAKKDGTTRTPEKQAELEANRDRRAMAMQIARAHDAQRDHLTAKLLGGIPITMEVARLFVYGTMGIGYTTYDSVSNQDGVEWWAKGFAGLLDPTFEEIPPKSNSTQPRGFKPRYKFLQPKGDEKQNKEVVLGGLWKFLDKAKTPEELFGRALAVIVAAETVMPQVLPRSKRWANALFKHNSGGIGGSQAPSTHGDTAAKALAKLIKDHDLIAPEIAEAVKAWKAIDRAEARRVKALTEEAAAAAGKE